MFQEAIDYPRNDENWIRTIAIGSVLALFSFLFVPALALLGYYMRVLRGSMDGDDTPPVFDDWGGMLVDGAKAFVVAFVYLLVPAIIFGVSVGGAAISALSGNEGVAAGGILGAFLGFALSAVVFLVVWYVVPAALANHARTGNIGAGFAFGEMRPALTSGKYAMPWLLALGVFIAAGFVVGLLNVIPFIGFIIAMPVNFYAAIVAFNLYGRGFEDATQTAVETPDEPAAAAI